MATSSAVPDELGGYGRRALVIDRQLDEAARHRLRPALELFRGSRPERGGDLPQLDVDVMRHAETCGHLEYWVEQVANGFRAADRGRSHGSTDVVVVDDGALARRMKEKWSLKDRHHRGKEGSWLAAVDPSCKLRPGARYRGGGFLTGPDGAEYAVVVPAVRIGRREYNGDLNLADGQAPIDDLGGADGGWTTVDVREDTYRTHKASFMDTATAAAAGSAGLITAAAPGSAYKGLEVDDTGAPRMRSSDGSKRPPDGSPPVGRTVNPSTPAIDENGRQFWLDPNDSSAGGWNRGMWRSLPAPPSRADAIAGGAQLLEQSGAAFAGAMAAGDKYLVHYQVVFQVNQDGRRRAIIRAFQLGKGKDGPVAFPMNLYVDSKGHLVSEPVRYRRGTAIDAPHGLSVVDTRD